MDLPYIALMTEDEDPLVGWAAAQAPTETKADDAGSWSLVRFTAEQQDHLLRTWGLMDLDEVPVGSVIRSAERTIVGWFYENRDLDAVWADLPNDETSDVFRLHGEQMGYVDDGAIPDDIAAILRGDVDPDREDQR